MRPLFFTCLALLGLMLAVYCVAIDSIGGELFAGAMAGLGFSMRDAQFSLTTALPEAVVSDPVSVTSDGLDLGLTSRSDFLANCELVITAPALATGDLPNDETMVYDVEHDDDAEFGTAETLIASAIVQTGAGGAGAAAATRRLRLPTDVKRYVRVKATNSGSGDASDKSFTAELLF